MATALPQRLFFALGFSFLIADPALASNKYPMDPSTEIPQNIFANKVPIVGSSPAIDEKGNVIPTGPQIMIEGEYTPSVQQGQESWQTQLDQDLRKQDQELAQLQKNLKKPRKQRTYHPSAVFGK